MALVPPSHGAFLAEAPPRQHPATAPTCYACRRHVQSAGARRSFWAKTRTSSGPHSLKHTVVPYKIVPQRSKGVQSREREQRIRQIPVNILGGLKYRPVFLDPEIEVKQAEMENAAMVNEGYKTDDWDDEH